MTTPSKHQTPAHMKSFYASLKRSYQNSRNGTLGAEKADSMPHSKFIINHKRTQESK